MKFTLIAGILLLLTHLNAYSQDTTKNRSNIPRCYFIGFGVGGSSLGSFSAMLNANIEIKNQWLLGVNIQGESNTALFDGHKGNEADVNTASFLIGKIYKQPNRFVTLSTGLSFVEVYTRDNNGGIFGSITNKRTRHTIGIPLAVQGYLAGFKTLGIGLSGYVNLNTIKTTAGFSVNFALGHMPTQR